MERYSVITQKNKREIVSLRGSGCAYRKCVFYDYRLDCCADERENFRLNKFVLDRVTGALGNPDMSVVYRQFAHRYSDKQQRFRRG